ncbi:hypothetical protein [Mesorhizobium sp.]|uniref:hypothetical protein n=1 Tax=Mesorhizobium sp. TaxID=1871066 RepID=UPI0025CBB623|nr:hypothetical protein [Mesorhizobium sp.]
MVVASFDVSQCSGTLEMVHANRRGDAMKRSERQIIKIAVSAIVTLVAVGIGVALPWALSNGRSPHGHSPAAEFATTVSTTGFVPSTPAAQAPRLVTGRATLPPDFPLVVQNKAG